MERGGKKIEGRGEREGGVDGVREWGRDREGRRELGRAGRRIV